MTISRRPRRPLNRNTGNIDAAVIKTSSAVKTARMRREQRSHRSNFVSFGIRQRKAPSRSKPVMYAKAATRPKSTHSRSMGSSFTRTMGTPPPVYVRGGMANLPVQPRKLGAPPKRRYNVALSVPGAELHLPALPALRLSWRALSGVMTALLLALVVHLWTSPKYRVDMVQVVGLQRLTANDVNTVVGLAGHSIFSANPQQIQQDLQQAFPDIKGVSVKVSLPAIVVVKAQERTPVILWKQGDSEQWVDLEGLAFPPRGEVGKLIVVDAKDNPPSIGKTSPMDLRFISPEMVGVIGRMAMKAPKDTPLLYDSEHGLGWMDPFGCQVYFGINLRDIDEKLLVYQALAARLLKDGIQPALISVEFLHAPYYRLER
jgi:cell division protein FtsQ